MRTTRTGIDRTATVALLVTLVCWASVPVFLRSFIHLMDGWTANGFRYPLAAIVLLPIILLARRSADYDRTIWRRALLPAGFNLVAQTFWGQIPYYLEAPLFGFLARLSVIWAVLAALVLFPAERVLIRSKRFWIGLFLGGCGFAGVTLFGKPIDWKTGGVGIVLILVCSFCFAMYLISVRLTMQRDRPMTAFAVVCLYTGLGTFVTMLLFGRRGDLLLLTGPQWGLLILSSFVGLTISHSTYYAAIRRLGVMIPATSMLLTPFLTGVMTVVFLPNEALNWRQWTSGVLAFAGSGLLIWSQQRLHARAVHDG